MTPSVPSVHRWMLSSLVTWTLLFLLLWPPSEAWLSPSSYTTGATSKRQGRTTAGKNLPTLHMIATNTSMLEAIAPSAIIMDKETISTSKRQQQQQKRLICIRHARSEGNEYISRPGNRWGDPTFTDDPNLTDARLAPKGMQQVREELLPKFFMNNNNQQADDSIDFVQLLKEVDLIIVSPLTRTQQTFQYGVLPALQQIQPNSHKWPPIVAIPLASERVYTAADTGRSVPELEREFPWVDWSIMKQQGQYDHWWYLGNNGEEDEYPEWRPHGQEQWYAVPGEPQPVFTKRMNRLEEWIDQRPERNILLVAHWGVIRHLTGGYDPANCEVSVLDNWVPLHQQQQQQQEG